MFRKFYLENEYGNRFNLQDPGKVLLNEISGLGSEETTKYINVGDSFLRDYFKTSQGTIFGTVNILRPGQYELFQSFSNFIYASKELKLIYVPAMKTETEYKRDVDVVNIGKTEISKDKVMRIPIQFVCKSLFYTANQTKFVVETAESERRYDFTYPIRYNDYNNKSVIFNNNGHVKAAFEIEILGYTEQPQMIVTQNGIQINQITFPLTVQNGQRVKLCTRDGDLYVLLVHEDGTEENIVNQLDIKNENFFKLPIGTSNIQFTSDTGAMNKIIMRTYKYFKVV